MGGVHRLAPIVARRWHFGIGDPNAVSWCIVAAYAAAVVCSVVALATARSGERSLTGVDERMARDQRAMKHLWFLISVIVLALGVNKQLDLQTLLIQTARDRAYANGWYANRRHYQVLFIAAVMCLGIVGTVVAGVWLRRIFRYVWLAVAGIAVLVVFVVVRAASFHYVDKFLALGGSVRVNWVLEFTGIGLVILAAAVWQRTERRLVYVTDAATVQQKVLTPADVS